MTGNLLWYLIAALVAAGALGLIVFLLIKKCVPAPSTPPPKGTAQGVKKVGFLEMENGTVHMLDSRTYLIGRHSSNDLTIPDPSVSRQHAEIRRGTDGNFRITDLESMNGVFVNNKQLKTAMIKGGELLELGDVAFRFKVRTQAEIDASETQMKDAPEVDENE